VTVTPSPASDSAIAVSNLSHSYVTGNTRTTILSQVTLEVCKGQSVALIGRSGSGKSTLLNLISGLEPIETGEVWLGGQAMSRLNDSERTRLRGRDIGFIYQAFNLIPTLNVGDNIALPLALAGMPAREQQKRLDRLLTSVGLTGRGGDYPDRLSGGEQQRVAIARALIHRPALILADEPTGNLDAQSGRQVLGLLTELVEQQGSALLLVTHSVEVASVADRLVVLEQAGVRPMSGDELANSSAW
jgi:putative ABC transport system ATP-binding protein